MSGPRVGLALSYDGTRAPAILRRVHAAELGRRLPELELRVLTPLGLPNVHDGGVPSQPLRDADTSALAEELDLLIVAGRLAGMEGEVLVAAGMAVAEAGGDVAWEPVTVTAGDPLPAVAGVGCELGDVELLRAMRLRDPVVLPGYARLLGRQLDAAAMRRHERMCELAGWLEPGVDELMLVEDDASLAARVSARLAEQPQLGAVVLGRPGDDEPTLDGGWPTRARKLPWYAGVDEYVTVTGRAVAAIGEAATRVVDSGVADARALALGQQLNADTAEKLAVLDGRLDALAARARAGWQRRVGELPTAGSAESMRAAISARSTVARPMALARTAMQVEIRQLELQLAQLEAQVAQLPGLHTRLALVKAELERVTTSRTWRYTQGARQAYRAARERSGRA